MKNKLFKLKLDKEFDNLHYKSNTLNVISKWRKYYNDPFYNLVTYRLFKNTYFGIYLKKGYYEK